MRNIRIKKTRRVRISRKIERIIESKVIELIGSKAENQKECDSMQETVALWVDTPNYFRRCVENRTELTLPNILKTIRENVGEIVFAGAFIDRHVGQVFVKEFRRHDFTLFFCTSVKKDYIVNYDPVDEQLDRTVRQLQGIADVHIIASNDRDFDPLVSKLRDHMGKKVFQLTLPQGKRKAVLELDKPIHIPLTPLKEGRI